MKNLEDLQGYAPRAQGVQLLKSPKTNHTIEISFVMFFGLADFERVPRDTITEN